jgi:hypothetical protein
MAVVVGRLRKCNVFDNPFTFSADELAREILGRPIVNTALLGPLRP